MRCISACKCGAAEHQHKSIVDYLIIYLLAPAHCMRTCAHMLIQSQTDVKGSRVTKDDISASQTYADNRGQRLAVNTGCTYMSR